MSLKLALSEVTSMSDFASLHAVVVSLRPCPGFSAQEARPPAPFRRRGAAAVVYSIALSGVDLAEVSGPALEGFPHSSEPRPGFAMFRGLLVPSLHCSAFYVPRVTHGEHFGLPTVRARDYRRASEQTRGAKKSGKKKRTRKKQTPKEKKNGKTQVVKDPLNSSPPLSSLS